MRVTIVGTGRMARAIARLSLAGGHAVTLMGRQLGAAQDLASSLGADASAVQIGAPAAGEVVVLAVPYAAVAAVVDACGEQLHGAVVVDICNPVDRASFTPIRPAEGSAAQQLARRLPASRVVKAFNTVFCTTLAEGPIDGRMLDVLVAGDDAESKSVVEQLIIDGGLRAIDAGPLARAEQLEALGYLHLAVQPALGTEYRSAVAFLG
jgi:predicted dinucleotide-binding enzyme